MYPKVVFLGMTLYEIFLLVGVIAALVLADFLAEKRGLSVGLQKTLILSSTLAVLLGYGSAVLFQACYHFLKTQDFSLGSDTGATFYGGLLGGALVFILVWFLVGPLLCKEKTENKARFKDILDIAAVCIPLAHGIGRIGCFFAGCCHGFATDGWLGVEMHGERVVPLQLFEAAFLLIFACAALAFFLKTSGAKRIPLMPAYLIGYGVWRFIIEFFRGDERGASPVAFLSPSQLTAVALTAVGIAYATVWLLQRKNKNKEN